MKVKILAILLLISAPISSHARDAGNIAVEARVVDSSEHILLAFKLKNESGKDFSVYTHDLPWGNLYSTSVVLVAEDADNTELRRVFPIDDPGSGAIVVKPKMVLEGKIDLSQIFPELETYRAKNNIIVFWFYRPKDKNRILRNPSGGMLLLKQKRR